MKKNSISHGSFQRMGLPNELLKAVFAMKYRLPTPIQRKLIPLIQRGRDVIAMSRTGSGKTAAFLIPVLGRLASASFTSEQHSEGYQAIQAIVLSPSRDLALQTYHVCRNLARHLNVNVVSMIGGENLNSHFDLMTRIQPHPMIVIATPGRMVHILAEMNINSIDECKFLILDEADRLFEDEDGFTEQLELILTKIPPSQDVRQTILTSATISQKVCDFVKSGIGQSLLHQPVFCRIDAELTLNPNLTVTNIYCPREEKL